MAPLVFNRIWKGVLSDHAFGPWRSVLDFTQRELITFSGRGCSIWSARAFDSSDMVALKIYNKLSLHNEVACRTIQREARIVRGLRNKRICQVRGAFEDDSHVYLVMDFCSKGNLTSYLKSMDHNRLLEEQAVTLVVEPVLQALRFLHFYGVIHRDVRAENIFVTSDKSVKLGNFKSAVNRRLYQPMSRVGTLEYMAPEIIKLRSAEGQAKGVQGEAYNEKVDIWSCGILAYELVVGEWPFGPYEMAREAMEEAICNGDDVFQNEGLEKHSPEFVDFIRQSLQRDHCIRPSAEVLLQHPWIRKHLQFHKPSTPSSPVSIKPARYVLESESSTVQASEATQKFEAYAASLSWSPSQFPSEGLKEALKIQRKQPLGKPPLPPAAENVRPTHAEDSFTTVLKAKALRAKTSGPAGEEVVPGADKGEAYTVPESSASGTPSPATSPTSVIPNRMQQFTTWPHPRTRGAVRQTSFQ